MAKSQPKAQSEAQRRVEIDELRAIISALEYPGLSSEGSLRLAQRLRRLLPPAR